MFLSSKDKTEYFLNTYGEMVYDLCVCILRSAGFSKIVFRDIYRQVRLRQHSDRFTAFERAWILRLTYQALMDQYPQFSKRVSNEDRIHLDSGDVSEKRLDSFLEFFHRLEPQDQFLLLLQDKYGIPGEELSAALGVPFDSLNVRRQQALRKLEEWVWKPN